MKNIKTAALLMIGGLVIQGLVGRMAGASQASFIAHLVLGALLLASSIGFWTRVKNMPTWSRIAVAGFVGIFIAGGSGGLLVLTGQPWFEWTMVAGAIIAMASYARGLLANKDAI